MIKKDVIIIAILVLIIGLVILFSIKNSIFQEACTTPVGLERFVYDELEFRPSPLFSMKMNLPRELMKDPRKHNSWIGGRWFPFLKLNDQTVIRYFNIFLEYNLANYPTVLAYIHSNIRSAETAFPNPSANMPPNQTTITKIYKPEELARKGMGKIQCIREFWKHVDEVYFVEPTTAQARDYFDLQGVAHSVRSEQDDDIESPFGLYAAKLTDGAPLILHFVWANQDEDIFFRDRPYSVFDILWSIRFDIIKH